MFESYLATPELIDLLPLSVASVDSTGHYRFINKNLADWLGVEREDIIGQHVADVMTIVDGGNANGDRLAFIRSVLAKGEPVDYESTVTRPNFDSPRIVSARAVPIAELDAVFVFFRDITAARLHQTNEAKLRAVVDTAGEGVIVMNTSAIIQSFNGAAERIFGYTASEIIGHNLKELMPFNYAKNHDAVVARYVETRVPHIIGRGDVKAEGLRKDGTVFPVELAVAEFEVGGELFFTGIVRDVTVRDAQEIRIINAERKLRLINENLEAEVQRRSRTLDRLFNLSDEIMGMLDYNGHFISVSPSVERVLGISVAETMAAPFMTFIHPDDRQATHDVYLANQRGEREGYSGFECRLVNQKDGSIRWLSWNAHADAEEQCLYVVGRDITEDRLRDEKLRQSQKMEAIGQLTGGIAHDFNNLLMAISGCLDLMNRALPEENRNAVKRYIEGAQSSASRAAGLIHRLLAFSRRQPLAPVALDLNEHVEGMRDLIVRTIGPEIEIIITTGEPAAVECDPNQLESGILNLIINARDAIDGAGRVIIETAIASPDECHSIGIPLGECARISVTDDGHGMDEIVQGRAFDPFFTTKPIGQGTGLGLSMLYGFVKQSGGQLKIHSAPEKGTTVTIYLPLLTGEIVTQVLPPEVVHSLKSGQGKVILLVEDEEIVRTLIEDVLVAQGYEVLCAEEGNSALKIMSDYASPIDLLVTDVGLPGLSGKQVAALGREIQPDLKVLFITGYAAGITKRADLVIKQGTDLLLKPFTMYSLQSKVSEMVELKVQG